jgi:hypothetical protein
MVLVSSSTTRRARSHEPERTYSNQQGAKLSYLRMAPDGGGLKFTHKKYWFTNLA